MTEANSPGPSGKPCSSASPGTSRAADTVARRVDHGHGHQCRVTRRHPLRLGAGTPIRLEGDGVVRHLARLLLLDRVGHFLNQIPEIDLGELTHLLLPIRPYIAEIVRELLGGGSQQGMIPSDPRIILAPRDLSLIAKEKRVRTATAFAVAIQARYQRDEFIE